MRPSVEPDEARTLLHEERARLQQIRVALEQSDGSSSSGAVIELPDIDQPAPVPDLDITDGAILDHVDARLADVDRALERLEAGEFGTCEACGRVIDADRLRARPAARFCVEHAHTAETLA